MKQFTKIFASLFIGVLIASACFAEFPRSFLFGPVKASPALPFTSTEYSDGTITPTNSPLEIWYTWVNVSGTQVINYALYTAPNYPYPVPISSLIGQHLQLENGSNVFVASALDGMEVYRAGGDGIPQSSSNQILYFMYSNMSDSYKITPIQKVQVNGISHYQWGFTYENVYAYLQNAATHLGVDVRLKLEHLTLSYDFSVKGNVSDLKTSFDIGQVSDVQAYDPATGGYVNSGFSFEGLSLSLLYASQTYASTPYSTYVNDQPYNSTTTPNTVIDASTAQVGVENVTAYAIDFGGNYTLSQVESNQTQNATVRTFGAKAEVASPSSLPFAVYGSTIQGMGFFTDELDLTQLFGGSWPALTTNFNGCSLIYRICFPTWDGQQITYDPLYVGYLSGKGASTTPTPEFPAIPEALAVILTLGAASVFVAYKKKHASNA